MGLCLNFYCGGRCRCGWTDQSFLGSNRFSDVDPVLGHGVPALAGIFSSGGGLLSTEEPPWDGFSWNFFLCQIHLYDTYSHGHLHGYIVCLGVGACTGLVTTHTLYHLVGINFLLLSFVFVPLLTKGLVLGWLGLG